MPPTFLALAFILALLALVPTRRLFLAGWPQAPLAAYFIGLWAVSVVIAAAPGRTRFLLPILVVAYLGPFVTVRAGIARLTGRQPRAEPRDVTPPDDGPRAGHG